MLFEYAKIENDHKEQEKTNTDPVLPILSPDPNDGFLASVRELARLSRLHVDVAYAIGKFIDSGKNFCSCECDFETAKATGRGLVKYKLHDNLMTLITTYGILENT